MDTAPERELQGRWLRRDVNDRVAELARHFAVRAGSDAPLRLLCECGRDECMTYIEASMSEYEATQHAGPDRWIVLTAHADTRADAILARRNGYALVQRVSGRPSEAPVPRKEST